LKKYSKLLAVTLCASIALASTGCGVTDKLKNAITNNKTASSDKANDSSDGNVKCLDYVTLGDYSTINIKKSEIDKSTKEQITKNIKSTGDYTKVKKGKIKKGDIVNIYYVGKVNGKTFEGGSLTKKTNKAGYDLEIGSNTFIDGFEDGLIGRKIGSKCKIKVTFPEQYSQNQDLAGKKAVFSVTINFKEVYPELSDKFVKKNMKDFDKDYENTAAGYTKYVRDNLLAEKAWSTFYDTCKVNDYPESKMKTMKTQLKTSITYYLQNNGYTLENYLKSQNSSMSDFNKQLETTAKTDVGKQLVYGAVAEKENITVSDKQYKEEVKTYLTNYNCKNEKELSSTFKDYYGVDAKTIITEDILYKNVKNFLIKNVKES
jgi:trigger factor